MTIQVVYKNGNQGSVTADMLDYLLETDALVSFKRRDGWVRPGCDKLRSRDKVVLSIPERRVSMNLLLESNQTLPLDELR